jgi:hypothetical protein
LGPASPRTRSAPAPPTGALDGGEAVGLARGPGGVRGEVDRDGGEAVVVGDQVGALTAVEQVGVGRREPVAVGELVRAARAAQRVAPAAAQQLVGPVATGQHVVAGTAVDAVRGRCRAGGLGWREGDVERDRVVAVPGSHRDPVAGLADHLVLVDLRARGPGTQGGGVVAHPQLVGPVTHGEGVALARRRLHEDLGLA